MSDKKDKLHDSDQEDDDVIEMAEKAPEDPNMVRDKRGKLVSKHELEKQ